MNTAVATLEKPAGRSVVMDMATRFGMEPTPFEATLRATVFPKEGSREQFAAFLLVAKQYNLNPILKEIYAFPTRSGGVQPIVGVDGWANLINSHPSCDGVEFEDHLSDGGDLTAITCRIYRKDRAHPTTATEYMVECRRKTETWNQWPRRMLRHKALIQAARYAFGFSGIVDPDEWERSPENEERKTERKPAVVIQATPGAAKPLPPVAGAAPALEPIEDAASEPAEATDDAPALLPPDQSAALREGLLKRLKTVGTPKALTEWAKSAGTAIATMQEVDRDAVQEAWDAKATELAPTEAEVA